MNIDDVDYDAVVVDDVVVDDGYDVDDDTASTLNTHRTRF